jgi:hypothetical protein
MARYSCNPGNAEFFQYDPSWWRIVHLWDFVSAQMLQDLLSKYSAQET